MTLKQLMVAASVMFISAVHLAVAADTPKPRLDDMPHYLQIISHPSYAHASASVTVFPSRISCDEARLRVISEMRKYSTDTDKDVNCYPLKMRL